jgi:hypothetical protein
MALIVLLIFSYALYRMTTGYNITPWKWIFRYIISFIASFIPLSITLLAVYGEKVATDAVAVEKIIDALSPFILLYQFVLFYFFRTRIIRYVHALDELDKNENDHTPPPAPPRREPKDQKDQKDFSYFR